MRALWSRGFWVTAVTVLVVFSPWAFWAVLNHAPKISRDVAALAPEVRQAEAKKFVAATLQLRNDIVNEEAWEARFTDQEVNSWLSEELLKVFADRIPAFIREPRIAFGPDRLTFVFRYEKGTLSSVIWIVARIDVPEENRVALTLEKIRAGMLPVAADQVLDEITRYAARHGVRIEWGESPDGERVAKIAYRPSLDRTDIALKGVRLGEGEVRLSGRSAHKNGSKAVPTLPDKKVLQATFPNRTVQPAAPSPPAPPTEESGPAADHPDPAPAPELDVPARINDTAPETRDPSTSMRIRPGSQALTA